MPLLRRALSAVNVETLEDWGTCMATAVVSFCYYGPNDLSHIGSKMLIISALVGSVCISVELSQLTNCLMSRAFSNRGAN